MVFRARGSQIFVHEVLSSFCEVILKMVQGCVHATFDGEEKGNVGILQ